MQQQEIVCLSYTVIVSASYCTLYKITAIRESLIMVFRECNILTYFSNIYDPVATALTVSHRSQSGNNGIRLKRNGLSQ